MPCNQHYNVSKTRAVKLTKCTGTFHRTSRPNEYVCDKCRVVWIPATPQAILKFDKEVP